LGSLCDVAIAVRSQLRILLSYLGLTSERPIVRCHMRSLVVTERTCTPGSFKSGCHTVPSLRIMGMATYIVARAKAERHRPTSNQNFSNQNCGRQKAGSQISEVPCDCLNAKTSSTKCGFPESAYPGPPVKAIFAERYDGLD
jgi:hypothetical protein